MTLARVEEMTGLQLEAEASLQAMLGRIADGLDKMAGREREEAQLWQDVHLVPILGGALLNSPTAGTVLDFPERFGPKDTYWWDVRRLSCWGFTAGTVNVFLNDATGNGELLASYPQAGQFTWGGQLFLGPRDRLVVVVAANVTGNVFVAGQAAEVASTMLPRYLI